MKKLILVLILFGFIQCAAQEQPLTTFILVRHAEKVADGTKDPALTTEGIKRAEELSSLFKQANITAIYSTNLKRTMSTVRPLAAAKNLEIKTYDWKDQKGMLSKMITDNASGTVVISGHSNTTPVLANILLGEEQFAQFDDSDYSNILVITASAVGNGKLIHLSY